MSTKIYHGFILTTDNLIEVLKYIYDLQPIFYDIAYSKICKLMAERAARLYDDCSFVKKENNSSPISEAFFSIRKEVREIEKTGYSNPIVDMDFSVTLLPINSKVLGLYFGEQEEMIDLWMGHPFVKCYPYWNNTDPDPNLSAKEWNQRRIDWDNALPIDNEIPAMRGFSINLCMNNMLHPSSKDIAANIPPLKERAHGKAKDVAYKIYMEKHKKKDGDIDENNVFSFYMGFITWLKTEDGQKTLNDERQYYEKLMAPSLTEDMLLKSMSSIPLIVT